MKSSSSCTNNHFWVIPGLWHFAPPPSCALDCLQETLRPKFVSPRIGQKAFVGANDIRGYQPLSRSIKRTRSADIIRFFEKDGGGGAGIRLISIGGTYKICPMISNAAQLARR